MPFNSIFTWPQAEQELQFRIGNRTDLGSGTADRIAQWLNSAQIRMASCMIAMEDLDMLSFPLTTVSGQSIYGLSAIIPPATNIMGIKNVRNDTTGVSCVRFSWTEFRSLNQQAKSAPLRWCRWGMNMAFDPQPDDNGPYTVLIEYRQEPQLGVVSIPNRFQDDWITVAEWIAWKALMKPDRAKDALSLLPASLAVLVSQPLDWDQWDSYWDTNQQIAPLGFNYPYSIGP